MKKSKLFLLPLAIGGAIAGTAIATSCSASTGFSEGAIGIYVEANQVQMIEKAIKAYKESNPNGAPIEYKVSGSFDALDLINTLGFKNQTVADLLYIPIDRIPSLVQNKALLGMDLATFGDQDINKDVFDFDGNGTVTEAEIKQFGETTLIGDQYYGYQQNKEALVAFVKGNKYGDSTKFDSLTKIMADVNSEGWKTSMYSTKAPDLWFNLGLLGWALNAAKTTGTELGNSLIRIDSSTNKYTSDMLSIENPTANSNAEKYKKFVSEYATEINKSVAANGKDWLVNVLGPSFTSESTKLFKGANDAFVIDGSWAKNVWTAEGNGTVKIVNIPSYIQSPGGWLYGINARNNNNTKKIDDMQKFISIILSNQEVVLDNYTQGSKITFGAAATKILDSAASLTESDKQLIAAVSSSINLGTRPDNGKAEFGNVWEAWDANGLASQGSIAEFKKTSGFDVNVILKQLVAGFTTAINKANSTLPKTK
ncbi:MAG: hypothetical protein ACRDA7_01805 [Metamycoplasmataceae bacterium]